MAWAGPPLSGELLAFRMTFALEAVDGVSVVSSDRNEPPQMTETVTIPAHIENGSLCLDAPLPTDLERVEVRGYRSKKRDASALHDLVAFLESLPPGTRSKEDIDREIAEGRGSWR